MYFNAFGQVVLFVNTQPIYSRSYEKIAITIITVNGEQRFFTARRSNVERARRFNVLH